MNTAVLDSSGILRVNYQSPVSLGALFEVHYLLGDPRLESSSSTAKAAVILHRLDGAPYGSTVSGTVGDLEMGPAVVAGVTNNAVSTFGLGVMLSLRNFSVSATNGTKDDPSTANVTFTPSGNAFNLTFAGIVNPNVSVLGSGLSADHPLPMGATVQLNTRAEFGLALIFSAGF